MFGLEKIKELEKRVKALEEEMKEFKQKPNSGKLEPIYMTPERERIILEENS